jgi:enoyl-CoA hydratase/carnithine racemase
VTGGSGAELVNAGFRRAFDAIAAIPCPTIAALDGNASAGGFELAIACDLPIAQPTFGSACPRPGWT